LFLCITRHSHGHCKSPDIFDGVSLCNGLMNKIDVSLPPRNHPSSTVGVWKGQVRRRMFVAWHFYCRKWESLKNRHWFESTIAGSAGRFESKCGPTKRHVTAPKMIRPSIPKQWWENRRSMKQIEHKHLSTHELGTLLGVTRQTIRNWIKRGEVRAFHLGHNLKIPGEEAVRILTFYGLPVPEELPGSNASTLRNVVDSST